MSLIPSSNTLARQHRGVGPRLCLHTAVTARSEGGSGEVSVPPWARTVPSVAALVVFAVVVGVLVTAALLWVTSGWVRSLRVGFLRGRWAGGALARIGGMRWTWVAAPFAVSLVASAVVCAVDVWILASMAFGGT